MLDADTGQVLAQDNADAQTYPASLTKMMTLYLTFEALNQGKMRLDQRLYVSAAAAAKQPSKLGLRPGDTVSVRNLILAIVTKSANDAAAVLAEGEAGSEAVFAERMNRKAQQLGMTNTFYHNASGLPDPLQHTTARDVARLALALYHDFPREYRYFSTRSFDFRGETVNGHDHLLDWYPGADGIKTGFINASGFNLASSAVQDGHRLIGVVMGGRTWRSRDKEMAQMLNRGFAEVAAGGPGPERGPVTAVATAAPTPAPTRVAAAPAVRETPTAPVRGDVIGKLVVAALRDSGPALRDAAASLSAVAPARVAAVPVHAVAPVHAAKAADEASHDGGRVEAERWGIQVGAYHAQRLAERAVRKAAKLRLTRGKPQQIVAPSKGERNQLYLARLVHFTPKAARAACTALHRKHIACEVVGPDALRYANR
ncbi:MAG: D-alanyl-D-alanine carboxypeptidase [Stellaceae bacterium]